MSFNAFMHSRNKYHTKPDFRQMANDYAEFRPFVKYDAKGKATIDFNDPNAVRSLTKTLLKKDFDLNVDIPHNRLIPMVPQRLNYVLWIEDLINKLPFNYLTPQQLVRGIDIGTGACAIFPLLMCSINKRYTFVATDVDRLNIEYAERNVFDNNLAERIKIIENVSGNIFSDIITNTDDTIHFCMCNPPFFNDEFNASDESNNIDIEDDDHDHGKLMNRRVKSNANTSVPIESVADGGELEFVTKIIDESIKMGTKVLIYTSMLGKKKSLMTLKDVLESYCKSDVIKCWTKTEFCQGKTKRWGIAWTMVPSLKLTEVPSIKSSKPKPPLIYVLPPKMADIDYDVRSVIERIKCLLRDDLSIDSVDTVRDDTRSVELCIKSNTNTWTGLRKKRREEKRKERRDADQHSVEVNATINGQEMDTQTEHSIYNVKRKIENDDSDNEIKKFKDTIYYSEIQTYLLHCNLIVKQKKKTLILSMRSKESAKNKETAFQLFQYFKNKLI